MNNKKNKKHFVNHLGAKHVVLHVFLWGNNCMVMQNIFWVSLWTQITNKIDGNLITLDRGRSHGI